MGQLAIIMANRSKCFNMDILDTSVIRGMGKIGILAAAAKRRVVVSPFTVWEILCHLDDVKVGETVQQAFKRRKGHIAILQKLEILHDPFAQHAAAVALHLWQIRPDLKTAISPSIS